jgi:hypothetical protein
MSKRKTTFLLFACLLVASCKNTTTRRASAPTIFHDPGGRVITVERWASVAGFAVAWAVYPDRIIVFTRNDFEKPESALSEHPIDASGFAKIRDEIERLPADLRGKHFGKEGVFDGVFFRISFSPNGTLASNRIEFENMHLPGVAPVLAAIDGQIRTDQKIHYEKMIGSRFEGRKTIVKDVNVP